MAQVIHQRIELMKILLISFLLEKNNSASDKKTRMTVKSDVEKNNLFTFIKVLLNENNVHKFLRVNEFEGITYFNKERFEELLKWLLLFNLVIVKI